MTPNTQQGQLRSDSIRSISRSWSGLASLQTWTNIKSMEGAETLCCPATAPKPERSGEDLYGGVGQNPCCSVCKPDQELQETSDICNFKQSFLYPILRSIFLLYQIVISCNKMEINYVKSIQCEFFVKFFLVDSVSHSLRCTHDENYRSLHSL